MGSRAGAQLAGAGWSVVPAQVTWAGLPPLVHACSTTSQSRQSGLLHRMAGARARVAFGFPLAFPTAQSGGSSGLGGAGEAGTPSAGPQPSARHTAWAAEKSQNAPHRGSQDCPSRTSTIPLQRLLPFTRRTRSPGSRFGLWDARNAVGAGDYQGPHH